MGSGLCFPSRSRAGRCSLPQQDPIPCHFPSGLAFAVADVPKTLTELPLDRVRFHHWRWYVWTPSAPLAWPWVTPVAALTLVVVRREAEKREGTAAEGSYSPGSNAWTVVGPFAAQPVRGPMSDTGSSQLNQSRVAWLTPPLCFGCRVLSNSSVRLWV